MAAADFINRHLPIYGSIIDSYFGYTLELEIKTNASFELITETIPAYQRLVQASTGTPFSHPPVEPLKITPELLDRAQAAIPKAHKALLNNPQLMTILDQRLVPEWQIKQHQLCSCAELYKILGHAAASNLSLTIPRQFYELIPPGAIEGISFPCYHNLHFTGFATRNIGQSARFVKYAFTTPGRLCWGLDEMPIEKSIYIVEGVFDALAMLDTGHGPVIAIGDSQPTGIQLLTAAKAVGPDGTIILCLDSDYAGCLGMLKAMHFLDKLKQQAAPIILEYKDPAEQLLQYGLNLPLPVTLAELTARVDELFDPVREARSWLQIKEERDCEVNFVKDMT